MKLNKREKILLYILLWAVLVSLVLRGISYTDEKIEELNVELISTQGDSLSMKSAVDSLEEYDTYYRDLQNETIDLAVRFYPVKLDRELDRMVTDIAVASGFDINSISLTSSAPTALLPYGANRGESQVENEESSGFSADTYEGAVSIAAEGNLDSVLNFINEISRDPGMRMSNLNITVGRNDACQLTATVRIFMSGIGEAYIYDEAYLYEDAYVYEEDGQ